MYAPITHQNTEHFWSPTQKFKIPDLSELKIFQVGTLTVFENHKKSRIQNCKRSELVTFTFQVDKSSSKMPKNG